MRSTLFLIAIPLIIAFPHDNSISALQDTFPIDLPELPAIVDNSTFISLGEDPSLLDNSIFLAKSSYEFLKFKLQGIKVDALMEAAAEQRRSRRNNKRAKVLLADRLLIPNPKNPKFTTEFTTTYPTSTSLTSTSSIVTISAVHTSAAHLAATTTLAKKPHSSTTKAIIPTTIATTSSSAIIPVVSTSSTTSSAVPTSTSTGTHFGLTSSGINLDVLHVGQGTYFDDGLGACGTTALPSDSIVAVSKLLYDTFPGATANPNTNPICGLRLSVTYKGKTIIVRVQDRCEGCAIWDLDFSTSAFSELADFSVGRLDGVDWVFL